MTTMETTTMAPEILREIKRMAAEMDAVGFDGGGHWHACKGAGELEEGFTYRSAGAPVFHDICQACGLDLSRARVLAALDRVAAGVILPTRVDRAVADAAQTVAQKRLDRSYRVSKPMLPPDAGDYYQPQTYPVCERLEAQDAAAVGKQAAKWLAQHKAKPFGERGAEFIINLARRAWRAALEAVPGDPEEPEEVRV
jgi:hypothetical protein